MLPGISRRLRHTFRRSEFRFADRVQQCCQSIARSFQWTPARDRVANRDRRFAHSIIRLFVAESLLVSVFAGAGGAFAAWHLVPLVPGWRPNFFRWKPEPRPVCRFQF